MSYHELQRRCTELKKQGKHNESCRQPSADLRRLIARIDRPPSTTVSNASCAPLVNDLVAIIATYAIEPVTYHLLMIAPSRAYDRSLWASKVAVETRGLMVDASIIGDHWTNYYRVINKSFYGNLRYITTTTISNTIGDEFNVPISSTSFDQIVVGVYELGSILIYQDTNFNIHIVTPLDEVIIKFGRRIIIVGSYGVSDWYVLDERCQLYYIYAYRKKYRIDIIPFDQLVVDINYYTLLTRAGLIFNIRRSSGFTFLPAKHEIPVVQLITDDTYIRSDGTVIDFDNQLHTGIMAYSGEYVTPDLRLLVTYPDSPLYGIWADRGGLLRATDTLALVVVDRTRSAYANLDREG